MFQQITEYALMAISTKKVFPAIFSSEHEAEEKRKRSANPNHWCIVKRMVIKFDWEEIK